MVFCLFISLFRDGKGKIVFKEEAKQFRFFFTSSALGIKDHRRKGKAKLQN